MMKLLVAAGAAVGGGSRSSSAGGDQGECYGGFISCCTRPASDLANTKQMQIQPDFDGTWSAHLFGCLAVSSYQALFVLHRWGSVSVWRHAHVAAIS